VSLLVESCSRREYNTSRVYIASTQKAMDSQWSSQPYTDSSQNRQPRYVDNVLQTNAQGSRDYGHHQQSPAQQIPPTMQSYQNQPYQAYQHGSSSSISSPPAARN